MALGRWSPSTTALRPMGDLQGIGLTPIFGPSRFSRAVIFWGANSGCEPERDSAISQCVKAARRPPRNPSAFTRATPGHATCVSPRAFPILPLKLRGFSCDDFQQSGPAGFSFSQLSRARP
jgi:hypothetical protein